SVGHPWPWLPEWYEYVGAARGPRKSLRSPEVTAGAASRADGRPDGPIHDGDARSRVSHLGDRVSPGPLAGAAHDGEVAPPEHERPRAAAVARAEQEAPRLAERHRGHHRFRKVARGRVAVPGDAVAPIAVVAEAEAREGRLVAGAEQETNLFEQRVPRTVVGERGQKARHVHHAVVQRPPLGPPVGGREELGE